MLTFEKKIDKLKARIPAHSASVEMVQESEDSENGLEKKIPMFQQDKKINKKGGTEWKLKSRTQILNKKF